MADKNIKYLNKDFTDFKSALVEYAKAYFPTSYNDFSTASPGSMFIDMAAYVGDILSFYLDNQIQESYLPFAKQSKNLYALSYMMGYKPKVISAATVDIVISQIIPSQGSSGAKTPNWDYALNISEGMVLKSTINNSLFYVADRVNFSVSSSSDPTDISIYSYNGSGDPTYYLLKKNIKAISGEIKTAPFTFTNATKFNTVEIQDTNIIQILDVRDSDNNKWYEVPYLAQDTILDSIANIPGISPSFAVNDGQVPYLLQLKKVPKRFVTRVINPTTLQIQFGAGVNTNADESVIPNPTKVGIGTMDGLSKLNTAYDPTNFTSTYTYGLAPSNTTLTFQYLVGGGAQANVPSNTITSINTYVATPYAGNSVDATTLNLIKSSLQVNNLAAATGGGDGDTIEEIRLNTLAQFPTQMRAVTQNDYLAFASSMPAKYGEVAKAYITKDIITFSNIIQGNNELKDPNSITLYVLGYDLNQNLTLPSITLKNNLKTYLRQYRMMTDTITIRDAYIINIIVDFEIILRPNYSNREVLGKCIIALQDYFDTDTWQINQPIILSNIYSTLDQVEGVQTVSKVTISNKSGESSGYSRYSYDITSGTRNGIIYPSLDPSIFEVKYPKQDIRGKVVTY